MTPKMFHLHLVSDSTGETVSSVSRAALAQFDEAEAEEHSWSLIRTNGQLDRVISGIEANPGIVFYTLAEKNLAIRLEQECRRIGAPVIAVLDKVVTELSKYLGTESRATPGRQHEMDEDYFKRVEAVNFALAHDDGQATWELEEADIVLVGVSRTSKSPTTVYLAYRGYKAANVAFVPGCDLPSDITSLKKPLVVGLTISAERLVQIRKSRLASINHDQETRYTDLDLVKEELGEARKFFTRHHWPVIDVTRKSVEETAAIIIQHYNEKFGVT